MQEGEKDREGFFEIEEDKTTLIWNLTLESES